MNDLTVPALVNGLLAHAGRLRPRVDSHPSLGRLSSAILEVVAALTEAVDAEQIPSAVEVDWHPAKRPTCAVPPPTMASPRSAVSTEQAAIRSRLAGWQVSRIKAHIDEHLHSAIYTDDLAALARLSTYYFCRIFRHTFGETPHRYVMRKRIELAQRMMLSTLTPLGQIASECGLSDQAHFNRLFRRFVGNSPGAWRRAQLLPMATDQ